MLAYEQFRSEWAAGSKPSPVSPALTQARSGKKPANVHKIVHAIREQRASDSPANFFSHTNAETKTCAGLPVSQQATARLEEWESRDVRTVPAPSANAGEKTGVCDEKY